MQEIDKLYEKVNVIPNRLEKFMAFTINKNLVFIDTMQFINFSLNKLVKNLTDNDFKYLSEEFSAVLKIFLEINCLIDVIFLLL